MNELKPCPFCGGEANSMHEHDNPKLPVIVWCECDSLQNTDYFYVDAWNTRTQSQWISVDDEEPVGNNWYWHTHIKNDGTFTQVSVGCYMKTFKTMSTGNFTHYIELDFPEPPKEQGQ